MLNTDLHNPGVKERMTLEGFIKNNAQMELPSDYLAIIYKNIGSDPLMNCKPRLYDFSKTEEVFHVIRSKKNISIDKIKEMVDLTLSEETHEIVCEPNMHLYYFNNGKIDKLNYPFIECFENFNYLLNGKSELNHITTNNSSNTNNTIIDINTNNTNIISNSNNSHNENINTQKITHYTKELISIFW